MTDTLIFQPSTERMSVWYDCGESFRGETYLIEEDLERFIRERPWSNTTEENKKFIIEKAGFQINAQSLKAMI